MALDTAQYQLDMEYMQEHKSEDVYSTFNLLMRRKPKASRTCIVCTSWAHRRGQKECQCYIEVLLLCSYWTPMVGLATGLCGMS